MYCDNRSLQLKLKTMQEAHVSGPCGEISSSNTLLALISEGAPI